MVEYTTVSIETFSARQIPFHCMEYNYKTTKTETKNSNNGHIQVTTITGMLRKAGYYDKRLSYPEKPARCSVLSYCCMNNANRSR